MSATSASITQNVQGRTVYLPLEKADKCSHCAKVASKDMKLKLCSNCAEVLYCSSKCQTEAWKAHKPFCMPTDRINLASYYPFIASIIAVFHANPKLIDRHPALTRRVMNNPIPGPSEVVPLPSGTQAKLVDLGKRLPLHKVGGPEWWPTAPSDEVRSKLYRRILYEGLVLPTNFAATFALLSEIYITSLPSSQRRVRLRYNSSPISDFGLMHGSTAVHSSEDKLAYRLNKDVYRMGQDPDDHFWIYFVTLAGEELVLDCNMFTFNCCLMASAASYTGPDNGMFDIQMIPAIFFHREFAKRMPLCGEAQWKPRKRMSVLRDPRLHELVRGCSGFNYSNWPLVFEVMEDIAGWAVTDWEQEMTKEYLYQACMLVHLNLDRQMYLKFPAEPLTFVEKDPGEVLESEDDEDWDRYMKKMGNRMKKGKITREQWLRDMHELSVNPEVAKHKSRRGKN